MSFTCNKKKITHVLRIIILDVTETAQEKWPLACTIRKKPATPSDRLQKYNHEIAGVSTSVVK